MWPAALPAQRHHTKLSRVDVASPDTRYRRAVA
jgi:hypothetical protein